MAVDTITEGFSNTLYDAHEHEYTQELTVDRPSSRNLIISPDLVAALEFDERVRRSSSPTPPNSAGLPPPPRSKNGVTKTRKAHSAGFQPLQHIPPNIPSHSSWNPYINPKPHIPYLMFEEPITRPLAASAPTSPVGTHKFVPQRAPSFGIEAESPGTRRAHRRYLSALPKVEWFFGKGAGGIGKKPEMSPVNEGERHESNGGISLRIKPFVQEKQSKRVMVQPGMTESVMATTTSPTGWCSSDDAVEGLEGLASPTRSSSLTTTQARPPTLVMAAAPPANTAVATATSRNMAGTGAGPAAGSQAWPGARVSVATGETRQRSSHDGSALDGRLQSRKDDQASNILALAPVLPPVPRSPSDSRFLSPHSRSLTTSPTATTTATLTTATITDMPRISSNSTRSTDTASSVSRDPEAEARISISSTVYPASSVDHSYDSHFSYHRPYTQSRPSMTSMSPDHGSSFIELASPVTTPRSPEFPQEDASIQERVTSIYSTTSFNVNPNLYKQKSKELPAIRVPSPGPKPPIPTAPKPRFSRRSNSVQPPGHRSSSVDTLRGSSPVQVKASQTLPPTTAFLNPRERAERVRQNRKLTQMFGQPPGNIEAIAFSTTAYDPAPSNYLSLSGSGDQASASGTKAKHLRGAASMSVAENSPDSAKRESRAVWPPPEGTMYLSLSGARRHSSPLTTQEFTLPDIETVSSTSWSEMSRSTSPVRDLTGLIEVGSEEGVPHSDWSSHAGHVSVGKAGVVGPGSPTSFMDLSDEDGPGDAYSIISVETPKASTRRGRRALFSPSTPSLQESLSPEEQAEKDRRRKRDKLARLHRFLGSRIPVDLVLAQVDARVPTPPPRSTVESMSKDTEARFTARIRRRRSSSAAELGGTWSDDIDRLKEDLNEREKAINVRRAVKMEKMFGVAPPQTLYHTRHNASPSNGGQAGTNIPTFSRNRTPPQSPITTALRNHNQSSYTRGRGKKNQRPGTADSSEPLIRPSDFEDAALGHALSDIYLHYRHSLNSLNDIIDRDDKESLVDLHDYLHGSANDAPLQQFTLQDTHLMIPSTSKAERRRSLPARASLTSLSSEFSVNSATTYISALHQDSTTFQSRRRRAAKLTQFFGVDYRDLMSEILDSIEKGVEEEGGRGTLKPDEVQDLLQKLRKLKVKRNNLS